MALYVRTTPAPIRSSALPTIPVLFLLMNADDLGVHTGPAIQHPLPQWMKDEEHDF
jgi:hypothetical protein